MISDQTGKRDPSTGKYITRNVIGNHKVMKEGYMAKQMRAKQEREGSPILEKKVSMKAMSTRNEGLISKSRAKARRGGSNSKKRSPSVMSMTQNSSSNGGFQFTMKMKNKNIDKNKQQLSEQQYTEMIGVIKQRISTNRANHCSIRSQLYNKATIQGESSKKSLKENIMIETNEPVRDEKSFNISSIITPRQLKNGKSRLVNQFLSPSNIVDAKERKTQ